MSDLPITPVSELPAAVQKAPAASQKVYEAALGFEEMLVQNLTNDMFSTDSSDGSDDGSDDSSSAGGPYASLLPQALAQGVAQDGGLGLAQQIWTASGGTKAT